MTLPCRPNTHTEVCNEGARCGETLDMQYSSCRCPCHYPIPELPITDKNTILNQRAYYKRMFDIREHVYGIRR